MHLFSEQGCKRAEGVHRALVIAHKDGLLDVVLVWD
jgi:hypothetical protein